MSVLPSSTQTFRLLITSDRTQSLPRALRCRLPSTIRHLPILTASPRPFECLTVPVPTRQTLQPPQTSPSYSSRLGITVKVTSGTRFPAEVVSASTLPISAHTYGSSIRRPPLDITPNRQRGSAGSISGSRSDLEARATLRLRRSSGSSLLRSCRPWWLGGRRRTRSRWIAKWVSPTRSGASGEVYAVGVLARCYKPSISGTGYHDTKLLRLYASRSLFWHCTKLSVVMST